MKRFCWHDWPKWSQVVNCYIGPKQFRSCLKCNKVSSRSVALASNSVNLVAWNTGNKKPLESED